MRYGLRPDAPPVGERLPVRVYSRRSCQYAMGRRERQPLAARLPGNARHKEPIPCPAALAQPALFLQARAGKRRTQATETIRSRLRYKVLSDLLVESEKSVRVGDHSFSRTAL